MRIRSSLFIAIIVTAFLSAFLAYEPRHLAPVRGQLSRAVASLPPLALSPLAPIIEKITPQAGAHTPVVAERGVTARVVRVPAIREAQNYGWIQLPRGTHVDLVEEQRDGFLVRYDESFVVIPRAAVTDGAVILRARRNHTTS
jgi:hypothetical protein